MRGREISQRHVSEISRLGPDYWWYAVRRAHVDRVLRRRRAEGKLAFLDFGCGPGAFTSHVNAAFDPDHCLGLDGTDEAVAVARSRGLPVRFADFRQPLELPFAPNAITCLDVLEHLDDPELSLRNLAAAAAADAVLLVSVPAMPSLFSRWDEVSGHRRRYTRRLLTRQLSENGWKPQRVRYIFSYCVVPAWLERRVLQRVQEFEFPRVSRLTNALLTLAGQAELAVGSPCPFGTSLFAIAMRA